MIGRTGRGSEKGFYGFDFWQTTRSATPFAIKVVGDTGSRYVIEKVAINIGQTQLSGRANSSSQEPGVIWREPFLIEATSQIIAAPYPVIILRRLKGLWIVGQVAQ